MCVLLVRHDSSNSHLEMLGNWTGPCLSPCNKIWGLIEYTHFRIVISNTPGSGEKENKSREKKIRFGNSQTMYVDSEGDPKGQEQSRGAQFSVKAGPDGQ